MAMIRAGIEIEPRCMRVAAHTRTQQTDRIDQNRSPVSAILMVQMARHG